jgi:hypothetical protein
MPPVLRADREQVLAYRLAAHHLVDRLPANALTLVVGACALPVTGAALALAGRIDGVEPATLSSAVGERELVATWSLRGGPHLFPVDDLGVFTLGILPSDESSLRALLNGSVRDLDEAGVRVGAAIGTVLQHVLKILNGRVRTKAQVSAALHDRLPSSMRPWCDRCRVSHVSEPLLRAIALHAAVCFTGVDANPGLARVDQWVEKVDLPDPSLARAELLRRFLRCFGPANHQQFAAWAGIGVSDARLTWDSVLPDLVEVSIDDRSGWMHEADEAAFDERPDVEGVRLLPPGDPFLWREQRGSGVVLVDGSMVARWRPLAERGRFVVELQRDEPVPTSLDFAIGHEAERLATAAGCDSVVVRLAVPPA